MRTELYELYDRNLGRKLEECFINEAYELMLKKEDSLDQYINDFKIENNEPNNVLGKYLYEDKEIVIYPQSIINSNNPEYKNKQLAALETIRHEIEHARNLKTIEEGRKDIESKVLRSSLKDYVIDHNIDYSLDYGKDDLISLRMKIVENYETNPGERIAEIKAWKYLVNLLKNKRKTEDLLIARSMLYYSYIRGYRNNKYHLESPTFDFLLKTGMFHDLLFLKRDFEKKDYCFNTRIMYGLPISYNEQKDKALQKVKLKRRTKMY